MQVRTALNSVVTLNACRSPNQLTDMHYSAGNDAMNEDDDLEAFDDKKEKDLTV